MFGNKQRNKLFEEYRLKFPGKSTAWINNTVDLQLKKQHNQTAHHGHKSNLRGHQPINDKKQFDKFIEEGQVYQEASKLSKDNENTYFVDPKNMDKILADKSKSIGDKAVELVNAEKGTISQQARDKVVDAFKEKTTPGWKTWALIGAATAGVAGYAGCKYCGTSKKGLCKLCVFNASEETKPKDAVQIGMNETNITDAAALEENNKLKEIIHKQKKLFKKARRPRIRLMSKKQ